MLPKSFMKMKFFVLILCFSAAFALSQKGTNKVPVMDWSGRIINGEPAVQGQFPWQVALYVLAIGGNSFCGGSIISDQWILTAGHCVQDTVNILVYAGNVNATQGQAAITKNFIQHEQFDPISLKNDLGLVKVDEPWNFDENIQAVVVNYNDIVGVGVPVTVSGWGYTSDMSTSISSILNYVTLTTIDNADCAKEYNIEIYDGVVCANGGDSPIVLNPCNGDSGGPLVNSDNEQVGIVSFGHHDGCESGHAAGFSRTSYFESWIKNNTQI